MLAATALQFVAWAFVLSVLRRIVPLLWESASPDVARYAFTAESIRRGSWPYAQFQFEYPPLTLIPLLIPFDSATVAGYAREFRIEMLAVFGLECSFGLVCSLRRPRRSLPGDCRRPVGQRPSASSGLPPVPWQAVGEGEDLCSLRTKPPPASRRMQGARRTSGRSTQEAHAAPA